MKKGTLLAHRTHFSDWIWSSWDPTWKTQCSQTLFFRNLVFYFPIFLFLLFFPWFLAYPWEIYVLLQHSSQADTLGFREYLRWRVRSWQQDTMNLPGLKSHLNSWHWTTSTTWWDWEKRGWKTKFASSATDAAGLVVAWLFLTNWEFNVVSACFWQLFIVVVDLD